MKRPASQYYWGDWRRDTALQACSLGARGLWHEMNCLMHDCEPYGHLCVGSAAMQPAQLARLVGITPKESATLLAELETAGVFSRTEAGFIFSRRMVRDEDLRNRRASGGQAGAAHGAKGALHGEKGGRPRTRKGGFETPLEPNKKPPPASASASAIEREEDCPEPGAGVRDPGLDGFEPTATAVVCRAIRQAGIAAANPSHPRLRSLVDAGADSAEFLAFVAKSLEARDPFAYLLGAVEGERKRAVKTAGALHRGPMPSANRQEAIEARNRAVADEWLAQQGETQ